MDWKDDWDEKQDEKYQKREARREAQAKKFERQEKEREKRRQEDFQRKYGCKICGEETSPTSKRYDDGDDGTSYQTVLIPSNTVRCRKCKRYVCHNCCVETGETSLDQVLANTIFRAHQSYDVGYYTCKHCLGY